MRYAYKVMHMAKESMNYTAALLLASGAVAMLYTFYYMQRLSYSKGVYDGISTAIRAYNLTGIAAQGLLNSATQSITLSFALSISYFLLPFAAIMFAMGAVWLFYRQYWKTAGIISVVSSTIFIVLVAALEFNFNIGHFIIPYAAAYASGIAAFTCGAYSLLGIHRKEQRRAQPISINPDTPYSNMVMLSSRLMKRLQGNVMILDMHFDELGMENLLSLLKRGRGDYSGIMLLAKGERIGQGFMRQYRDFKNELDGMGIPFELRLLNPKDASEQHERMIIDDNTAYKIPPLNIINRKSEHIVGISHREASARFTRLWAEASKLDGASPRKTQQTQ